MWIPLFDNSPTEREKEKFMNSYHVRQLEQYKRLYNDMKDLFVKERTGAYPIWHFEIGKRDGKHKVILTDSMPIPLSDKPVGDYTVARVRSDENVSFKDTLRSLKNSEHGFGRQIAVIKGEIDVNGRVNNPTHWADNPNIKVRRSKDA